MKKIKLISLLAFFVLVAGSFFIFAKRPLDDKPETVMVYIYGGVGTIDYGKGKTETFDEIIPSTNKNSIRESRSKLLSIIQRLNNEGYKVVTDAEIDSYESTLILTRK